MPFEQPAFNWDTSDTFQEFQRFKQHVQFTFKGPLSKADNKDKAGWLGMWIGPQGREIYKTFTWTVDPDHPDVNEQDDPDIVLQKLENYVRPAKNKRVARFKAQQRKQKEGESFDNFVKDLRILLLDCEYTHTDDMLVDLIINGVKHKKVQLRLLDQGQELTLNKAIEIGRQYELSQSQMKIFRGEEVLTVKSKHSCKNKKSSGTVHKQKNPVNSAKSHHNGKCGKCGTVHDKGKCPASGTVCKYCKKRDHWLIVCRKRLRKVNLLQEEDSDGNSSDELAYVTTNSIQEEDEYLDILTTDSENQVNSLKDDKWLTNLTISNKSLSFRIDTGAKCNILVKSEYDSLAKRSKVELQKSNRTLKSFSNHKIKPVGSVTLPVRYKDKECNVTFEVVNLDQENIISGNVAENLGLVQRVSTVNDQKSYEELTRDFPDLVKTTGTLPGEYTIKIEENAQGVVHPARRLPAALKQKAIDKLKEMEENGYITPVSEPTEWVSSMVVSSRKDKIRICIDPKDLNAVIKREHYPMRTIDDVISDIPDAKVFSKLDAKSGFLQIRLDRKSSYLTTFNTPIGRFRWLRLPFGIKCSPEIYQRIMDQMLEGIDGAFVIIDDILIAGRNIEHHDQILKSVIARATEYNLKLNYDKCYVRQSSVPYMGHLITAQGLQPDPDKVKAIIGMPQPKDKEGVKRFLGIVQYLARYIPNLSKLDAPLRILLQSDVQFIWEYEQEASFQQLKYLISTPPVLGYYNVNDPVQIECDSSKDGIGAVLMQNDRVIAYASRALTDTEKRYAQIEKECLSVVYSTTKFHRYIFNKRTVVYNDHKPLEQIFKKPLLSAPMRIQNMMLKLQWYDLEIRYRKGTEMHVSDALSRAYIPYPETEVNDIETIDVINMISVSKERYAEIQELTQTELNTLYSVIVEGWPEQRSDTPTETRQYWDSRDQLSVLDSIIYKGSRIVIPPSLRADMLKLIHKSHLGIVKCKQRAREVMYWPNMNTDIENTVKDCNLCAEFQNQQPSEPLKPTTTPDLPYNMVGCDLFEFESKTYLLTVDYYSKYIDTVELSSGTTTTVINALKTIFATHGIPVRLRSDNGPQFSSSEFKDFCKSYGIEHETSSPHFQSSNGEAERAIQTVKRLWKKSSDKQLSLLDYRTTPIEGLNLSPSQLLMGRRPRNVLPASKELLKPSSDNTETVKKHFNKEKTKQKFYYDHRKGAKELPPLESSTNIRMSPLPGTKSWVPGTVVEPYGKPRSYIVKSGNRLYRRNRKHLRTSTESANKERETTGFIDPYVPSPPSNLNTENVTSPRAEIDPNDTSTRNTSATDTGKSLTETVKPPVKTRSGRSVKPPQKLNL